MACSAIPHWRMGRRAEEQYPCIGERSTPRRGPRRRGRRQIARHRVAPGPQPMARHRTMHAHRDRQLRPDRGSRRPPLGRADRAFAPQFPHWRGAHAETRHPRARHRQARGCRSEPPARLARCPAREGDRARSAGSDRRQARRSFSIARVADRFRHPDQHERQRGDRGAGEPNARRKARRCIRTITSI